MPSILDGVAVIDLGTTPAAAMTSMLLADQGARVVRIVSAGEASVRAGGFVVWDRG